MIRLLKRMFRRIFGRRTTLGSLTRDGKTLGEIANARTQIKDWMP